MFCFPWSRDHFVYVLSQWETTLHCNVVSHWLGAYTNRSLLESLMPSDWGQRASWARPPCNLWTAPKSITPPEAWAAVHGFAEPQGPISVWGKFPRYRYFQDKNGGFIFIHRTPSQLSSHSAGHLDNCRCPQVMHPSRNNFLLWSLGSFQFLIIHDKDVGRYKVMSKADFGLTR